MTENLPFLVAGSYFEACNCEAICPCRSVGGRPGGRSTTGVCEFALSWHIDHGRAGEVDLSGLDAVLAGFYRDDDPGSPWEVVFYTDDRADPEQAAWLPRIFLGRAGGGSQDNYGATIGTVHAIRSARLDVSHETGRWAIGVDPFVRVRASQVVDCDEPVACGIPGLHRPGRELIADVLAVDDVPLSWEMQGRCAFESDFEYSSEQT